MKRALYILLVVAACTVMVLLTGVALVQSGRVQTAVTRLVAEELSRGLNAEVQVERVKIHFFHRLDLYGVYMSDQTGDTLLSVPRLQLNFNPRALEHDKLEFPSVEVERPYVYIKQDSVSTNIDFLLRAFASDGSPSDSFPFVLGINEIRVQEARFRYSYLPAGKDVLLSRLNADIRMPYLTKDSVSASLASLGLRVQLHGVDAYAEGDFHGTMDSLFADRLEVRYRGERILLGSVETGNVLHWKEMQAKVNCQDLYCNRRLLQDLLSDVLSHPVRLPGELQQLGDMHYRGVLEGKPDKVTLHGVFLTRLGSISTDCLLQTDTSFSDIRLKGKIAAKRFQLGRLLPDKGLKNISFSADVDTRYRIDKPLYAKGNVYLNSFDYKDYTYRNLHINGELADSVFTGRMGLQDDNLSFLFNGTVDFSNQMPLADFTLRLEHLRLKELHLYEGCKEQDMCCTCRMNVSAHEGSGNWIDRLNGQVRIDSLYFTNNGERMLMQQMTVYLDQQELTTLKVLSDNMTACVTGYFRWSELPSALQRLFSQVLPATVPAPSHKARQNQLQFYCYLKNTNSLLAVTRLKNLAVPRTVTLKGSLDEETEQYELRFLVPQVVRGNSELKNLTFSIEQEKDEAWLGLSLTEHTISYDSTQLRIGDINMSVATRIRSDSLYTFIAFDDVTTSEDDNTGINIHTYIGKEKKKPFINLHILPSLFYMRDTVWTLTDSEIEYVAADTILAVKDFNLQSASQYIRADGRASTRITDSVHIELKNVNLPYFLQYVGLEDAIAVDGLVSGWATLYSLFSSPMFEANVRIPDARLNYTSIGDVTATATLDKATKHILLEADAYRNGHQDVHVTGNVIPAEPYWELFIHAEQADLRLVNFWTDGFLSDIEGEGYGDLHVFGRHLKTWVTARMYAKNAALTVPFTGARYYLSDSLRMDTCSISFPAVHIRDAEGHTGLVQGEITHRLFKDFHYHISARVEDLLALDIPYSSQQMYYGKVYASGNVDIRGDEQLTDINVYARTRKKTDFYLCVTTASDAADNSFIEFVDNRPQPLIHPTAVPEKKASSDASKVQLSMVIDATPDATVHVTLDSHNSDGITGKGEGNLRFTMDAGGEVRLFGTYTLLEGMFSYAVGNLLRRDFSIVSGSSVSWSGDPLSPTLNASAKYRVTASLRDLFGDDLSQIATNRSSIPVECVLYISDRLFNPVLRFGIELPQSDEAVASQVKAIINTEEMLMRQVIYLLAFNRFYTPEYMQNTVSVTNETYSLLSSTVTGQINAWLSRLTDIVSVGFNFRTDGEGASASQEYETQFQLRPVSRLSINGNFGYRYNDISNRPFYGDVDIEYQLTPNGKIRAKAFTHTVDKYSLKQASTVQGVGFVFRHDFNVGERKKRKEKEKKEETK